MLDYATCKSKHIYGNIKTVMDTEGDIKGGKIQLTANPEKGRDGKDKIKYADRPRNMSTGDNICTSAWPRTNLI